MENTMKHENGFEFDEMQVVKERERYLFKGKIVALQCIDCKNTFKLEGFNNTKGKVAGKQNKCKACHKKDSRQWSKNNPDKIKERNERCNGTPKFFASHHNSRAQKYNNQGKLTGDMVEQMFEVATRIKDGKKVIYCQVSGKPIEKKPNLGHVIAVDQEGGDSSLQNMIVISQSVNKLQGNMNLFDWLLTEKGQEVANKEYVKWLVEYLSQLNSTSKHKFLMSQLGSRAQEFHNVYYKQQNGLRAVI